MEINKVMKKTFLALMLSFGLLPNIVSPVLAQNKTIDVKKLSIKGTIFDSKTKQPLKDVYIKQAGTLNTVITNDSGSFSMTLDNNGEKKLLIMRDGYESLQYSISEISDNLSISLFPAVKFQNPNLPEAHSDTAEIFNYSSRPISSNFTALYQARYQLAKIPDFNNQSIFSRGWSINEISVLGQIRLDDLMANIKVFRSRYPVEVEGFDYKPVYYLDNTQFQVGGGKVFKLSEKSDFYAGLSYLMHFVTPDNKAAGDNKPVPYTSSHQDFPQTRQGLGVSGIWGYNLQDNMVINAGASLYPVVFTTFDSLTSSNMGYHGMLEGSLSIKYETIPGVYLSGNYSNQFYFGTSFLDDSNFFSFGVSLDPFKMASLTRQSFTENK